MAQREPLISKEKIAALFGKTGFISRTIAAVAIPILGIHKFNKIDREHPNLKGRSFAHMALKSFGVTPVIPGEDLSFIPKDGPCIFVCNHPFGMIDALTMIDRIGSVRPDLKVMSNYMMNVFDPLKEYFMPVNPFTGGASRSLRGMKMSYEHVKNGGALVIFPAGEVSSDRNPQKIVKDVAWQPGVMKLIKRCNAPVVPVYFHGQNSPLFHKLGHIHPVLRTLRLVRETTNKAGLHFPVRIAKPIPAADFDRFTDPKEMAAWLYARTYVLEAEVAGEKTITPIKGETVQPHIPVDMLEAELAANAGDHLFTTERFAVYYSRYEDIPNFIHELGVCREETFRAVGEGTGTSLDLDQYDPYYGHIYIWDTIDKELVGAYRLGLGWEIVPKYGVHGFYSDSLFRYSDDMAPVLSETLELGRSFVACKYQKSPLPLVLLLQGIFRVTIKYDKAKYYCGPVTTSGAYPIFYRSLLLKYLKDYHGSQRFAGMVDPIDPFEPDFGRVDIDVLLKDRNFESVEQFDRYMLRLSNGRYRMPTLVKKYFKLGVEVLDFNVDPTFNYCVDSLIFIKLSDVAKEDIDPLIKDIEDKEAVYKRLGIKLG